jgi:hypothetical protein
VTCSSCGFGNRAGIRFCVECGTGLAAAPLPAVPDPVPTQAPSAVRKTVTGAEIESPLPALSDGPRCTHSEIFLPEQLAAALARFEELEDQIEAHRGKDR